MYVKSSVNVTFLYDKKYLYLISLSVIINIESYVVLITFSFDFNSLTIKFKAMLFHAQSDVLKLFKSS